MNEPVRILIGDVRDGLRSLPAGSVHCCVTSPPYWGLRDYGVAGQIGLEPTPDAFVAEMVDVFREVRRVLRDDGTLWLNLGDSYASATKGSGGPDSSSTLMGTPAGGNGQRFDARKMDLGAMGLKPKDLCMMPWRVALALQADGWWIRSVIVWAKKSPMPESVTDRPTSSWEPIFLMSKAERYFFDAESVREAFETPDRVGDRSSYPSGSASSMSKNGHSTKGGAFVGLPLNPSGRNLRNVWTLSSEPYAEAHFATFPTEIPRRAIKAGTSERGCCPTCGVGWVRVLDRQKLTRERPNDLTKRDGTVGTGNHCANTVAGVATRTTGWRQGCDCPAAEPVPCTVLDPFLGSGTTVAVARTLGRHGVGCELNPKYAELARIRIGKAEKPDTFVDPRAKDSPLFQEAP